MFSFPFSSQQGPIFIALFNYEQRTSEDLTFKKGDKLEIINSQVLTHALCVWSQGGGREEGGRVAQGGLLGPYMVATVAENVILQEGWQYLGIVLHIILLTCLLLTSPLPFPLSHHSSLLQYV